MCNDGQAMQSPARARVGCTLGWLAKPLPEHAVRYLDVGYIL